MRRLIALLCGWLVLAAVCHAAEPVPLQDVLTQLAQHDSVRATFEQRRENPALAQPQLSRGQLLFVLGHGMLWQVQSPYAETIALTSGHATRVDAQGNARAGSQDRGVAQVSQMLQSMLAGKQDEALRQFDVVTEGSLQHWKLSFTPRQARVARVLKRIELEGGAFLESIRVDMLNGESSHIQFDSTREAGPLSEPERRALGMPP